MTASPLPATPEAANRFLAFVNNSPTPFHAVHQAANRLERAGFRKLRERDEWEKDLKIGGKYYYTRNQSSLLAFTIPQGWKHGTGISIVATHIDSPNLRVRPVSNRANEGYLQLGIETYGLGLWHTWFDRDLALAGRVIVGDTHGAFTSKLIKIDQPILKVPSLAIHLDHTANDAFKFNQETEMVPIMGLLNDQLNHKADSSGKDGIQANHHSALLTLVAQELSVTPEAIQDFELHLYDTQPSCLGGLNNEFIFSPRLDNLFSSFAAIEAITEFASSSSFSSVRGNVNCIALFNHEEIGSVSSSGAESSLLPSFIERLSPTPSAFGQSIARSFLVSCDMGHGIHPNYTAKHEVKHKPMLNGGIVLKTNARQKYATDAIGAFILRKLVEPYGGNVQEYEFRNDMDGGTTVGPHLSKLGLRTVDVGGATLSMHSIRETAGSHDIEHMIQLFSSLFENFADVDAKLTVE